MNSASTMQFTLVLIGAASLAWAAPPPALAPKTAITPTPASIDTLALKPIAFPGLSSTVPKVAVNLPKGAHAKETAQDQRFFEDIPERFTSMDRMWDMSGNILNAMANGTIPPSDVASLIQKLFRAAQATSTPRSVSEALRLAGSSFDNANPNRPRNLLGAALALMINGFTSDDLKNTIDGNPPAALVNDNPPVPADKNFYQKDGNAPFSVSEDDLRAAIHVPSGFTWGQKQPVLMSPGTGSTGLETFEHNFGGLLASSSVADPVYLIVPHTLLDDVQVNAEFVAYALQYLNAMTNRTVAAVTWSQGSVDTQWALKYWPSVRKIVTDHIPISGDYGGTTLAYLLCPGFSAGNQYLCTPAILQQTQGARFIHQLRSNDGDSAFVPTTSVYSAADEIVQPQLGEGASAFIKDVRGVGVSNIYLQRDCASQPSGGLYLHEGVLYNPTAYALIIDALTHDGPGSLSRVTNSCRDSVAPGLNTASVIQAETLIPSLLYRALTYSSKLVEEPAIKSYATY